MSFFKDNDMVMTKTALERAYKTKTAKQIAEERKVHVKKIHELLKKYEIPKPVRDIKGQAIDTNFVQVLYKAGYSIPIIAKDLNATYNSISNIIKGSYENVDKDTLEKLYNIERKGYKEIGEILGVSETTAWRWVKRFKIERTFNPPKEEFINLYKTTTTPKLAKHYNVSEDKIKEIIHKYECKLSSRIRTNKYTKEQIEGLYKQTTDLKELSKILGVCEFSVYRILRRFNVISSRKKTFEKYLETDVEKERVYSLYKELSVKYKTEWVVTEISEKFKVSKAEVKRCLKRRLLTE
jgi:transposase